MMINNKQMQASTSIQCVIFAALGVVSALPGAEFENAELQRMIREKDYPELTHSPKDQRLASKLLEMLGGHRDSVGNIYLSRSFKNADMEILTAFDDAPGILMHPSQVTDEGMAYIRRLTSVRVLNPLPHNVTDAGIAELRGLPLRGLKLPPKCTDKCMETIATLKKLRGIGLSQHISGTGFVYLSQLPQLTGLNLNESRVTDAAFANIDANPKIWSIDFGTAPNITPEVGKHLQQLPRLARVVGPESTNDRFLELLAPVKTITGLKLADYEDVTDEGMKHLAKLERLHDLSLGPGVTDAGMPHLGKLKDLTNLDLTKTQVTGAGLAHLGPFGPSKLELSDSVSDEGLASISKFTRLSYLILKGGFSDACLKHLPKRLNQVKFVNTNVTEKGLNKLRRERLGLIIDVKREGEFTKPFDQRSIDLGRQPPK